MSKPSITTVIKAWVIILSAEAGVMGYAIPWVGG